MENQDPEDPRQRFHRLTASEEATREEQAAVAATPNGTTRHVQRPAVDQHGMPLPRRVEEIDVDATRVTPAAYQHAPPPAPRQRSRKPATPTLANHLRNFFTGLRPRGTTGRTRRTNSGRRIWGCLLRSMIYSLFTLVALALLAVAFVIYQYYTIAATLPSVEDLKERASQFETTRILDRDGNVIYEINDPTAGRRTHVPLTQISPYLVAATIATEDKEFYSHPGFDPIAILRAFWQNLTSGETVSGASTITQQLARTLLLSPEERYEQSYWRKIREAILAAEITRRYTKDEILELYLNEAYYGNLAYGIEAAAQTYFGKSASDLTLGEATFLAGLPQAPAIYDIYTNPEATLHRHRDVIVLMYQLSQEEGCIYVSNSPARICVDVTAAATAAAEIEEYPFRPPVIDVPYPHWAQFVRAELEALYDPQTIYRSGFTVYTTLDPLLQNMAQEIVTTQVATLADRHVTNGALVAIDPSTGEILAMVGSADFYNVEISGQVNMATSQTRQPGSSIKPITYVAAFEMGWTPATLIWDVPSNFPPSGQPNDPREPYVPVNYDGRFHGPVTVRSALANSYNIPAVKTLNFVGIFDNPETPERDGMIAMAERLGITSLTRDDYGLSLTLGGGDVSLFEMTGAFAVFANGGQRVPPVAILRIVDFDGNVVYQYEPPEGEQVIRPEHAFLISSILSDNVARSPMFGSSSILNLPFPAAAKTGTTNDFRDNWTLGYTPDLVVGVWVGNADYTPMQNTTGLSGAAPIWSQFMMAGIQELTGGNPSSFIAPPGVVQHTICAATGAAPSDHCPSLQTEFFAADQPPLPAEEDIWQQLTVDTWTGLEAAEACDEFTYDGLYINVSDPFARLWLASDANGQDWIHSMGFSDGPDFAPDRACAAGDPQPTLEFVGLTDGQEITSPVLEINVIANAPNFHFFHLDYGSGDDPSTWITLAGDILIPASSATNAYTWNLTQIEGEMVSLRLYMHSTSGGFAERTIRLRLRLPTPTPTLTPEPPTATPTATPTVTPTVTPTTAPSPTSSPTPSPTPTPSLTPIPTSTPTPTPT
ncbi:MAG: PBP1A family penicillin-binding protein [Anaerolineales bacterium]|nr:PBP1A family penicillin-binding protein [Anaerolineales bacterium]